ncbi:MAG: RDD family protein [Actinomycetaceae bacterium]|nr:RDD family protein [Actinomycetaceae bacterium]MDU0969819.1 RDD family protein [Actinomycetaceae bacterium]
MSDNPQNPYPTSPQPGQGPADYGTNQPPQYYAPGQTQQGYAPNQPQNYPPMGYDAMPNHNGPAAMRGVQPVSLGRRVLARILDSVVQGIALAIVAGLIQVIFDVPMRNANGTSTDAYNAISSVISILILILACTTGWFPGSYFLGVRTVKFDEASAPKWNQVAKSIIEFFLVIFLVFPYLIVVFGTRDEWGRHWVDRKTGLIVIDTKSGADPLKQVQA